jgi:hypothetical protein
MLASISFHGPSQESTFFESSTATTSSPDTPPTTGIVAGIDYISELVDFPVQNLKEGLSEVLKDGQIKVLVEGPVC